MISIQKLKKINSRKAIILARRSVEFHTRDILIDPNIEEFYSVKNAWVYSRRGEGYYTLGEYDKAIKDFDISIKIDNKQKSDIFFFRGACYYKLGEYDKAIEDLKKAIHSGLDYYVYHLLALCYKEIGNKDGVKYCFRQSKKYIKKEKFEDFIDKDNLLYYNKEFIDFE